MGEKMLLNEKIEPFVGVGDFKLYMSIEEAKAIIKKENHKYTIEVWENKGCTPEIPWTILRVEKSINLFFANNKLFKIYLENDFIGKLDNGICIGLPMKKVLEIDSSLEYDDWNEDFQSKNGYWIEDDLDNETVATITVFIPEILDDDVFFQYNW
jgi:hypothetical protein